VEGVSIVRMVNLLSDEFLGLSENQQKFDDSFQKSSGNENEKEKKDLDGCYQASFYGYRYLFMNMCNNIDGL